MRQTGGPQRGAGGPDPGGLGALTRRYWYHFTSLVAIAVFMVIGHVGVQGGVLVELLAVALSYLRRETALTPVAA